MDKRILVIDDDEAVRDAFDLALDSVTPCRVVTAASGEQGLAEARDQRPDLVFLDLRMPGMDGITVLRELNRLDPSIPVYIVTGFQAEFFRQLREAQQDGLRFEIASKPLNGEQIREIAGVMLDC